MEMMLPIELIIAPLLNYIWELALLNIALLVARVLIFAVKVNVLYLPAEICQGLLLAIVLWTCGGVSRLFDVEYALRIEFQVRGYLSANKMWPLSIVSYLLYVRFAEYSFTSLPTLLYVEQLCDMLV
jgi:hypothetical protein